MNVDIKGTLSYIHMSSINTCIFNHFKNEDISFNDFKIKVQGQVKREKVHLVI